MPAYLLDTNHLIALLNRIPAAVEKQRQLEETGSRVCSTTISLGELYFGAFHSRHRSRNFRRLSRVRRRLVFLPFGERAAIEYGRIREETHSRGTPAARCDIRAHFARMTRSPRGESERGGGPPLSVGPAGRAERLPSLLQASGPSPRTKRGGGWSACIPPR